LLIFYIYKDPTFSNKNKFFKISIELIISVKFSLQKRDTFSNLKKLLAIAISPLSVSFLQLLKLITFKFLQFLARAIKLKSLNFR
jgi:hypothetical protein